MASPRPEANIASFSIKRRLADIARLITGFQRHLRMFMQQRKNVIGT